MKKEDINNRDFVISQIPELSAEGNNRDLFIKIDNIKIIKTTKDELNKNKQKMIINFNLKYSQFFKEPTHQSKRTKQATPRSIYK